jgi:NAD(P)-dependent dehydrogenase (short-subunit alcohol dehydrogenase family)
LVCVWLIGLIELNKNIVPQVTTIQADAADEAAISGVCKQALNEEGKLDVFFANVGHVATCSPTY